jgi:hypothetical protein
MTMKKKRETTVTSVRLPVDLRDSLNKRAEKNFRSVNAEIVYLLRKGVEAHKVA